ncbi:MAG: hypothetical protein H6574_17750 [Lewinellaceae bacterium]|nr:hypothetical protein [Saprospiraceae bacterium]MCB9332915.1 hypothetical protein [Lewinellaceae bacterium]
MIIPFLLLLFLMAFSIESRAQGTNDPSVFVPTQLSDSYVSTLVPLPQGQAIDNLETAIDQLRSTLSAQSGLNEAIWDIKITYFEAIRQDIADQAMPAIEAVFAQVNKSLTPRAAKYNYTDNAMLQSFVDEAMTLTHN